jgi:hypothetical protein
MVSKRGDLFQTGVYVGYLAFTDPDHCFQVLNCG